MERSVLPTITINEFRGVQQLLDDLRSPASYVPGSVGFITEETRSLRRMRGKLLHTTSPCGSLLVIQQVRFQTQNPNGVVVNAGGTYWYEPNITELLEPAIANPNPLIPFVPVLGEDVRTLP